MGPTPRLPLPPYPSPSYDFTLYQPDFFPIFILSKSIHSIMPNTTTADWTRDDFLALVLIYASHADLKMSDDEVAWIKQQVGNVHFNKANELYQEQSDYQNIETICELKKQFFPGEEGKKALQDYMASLFEVDHEYSHLEEYVMIGLKRLF